MVRIGTEAGWWVDELTEACRNSLETSIFSARSPAGMENWRGCFRDLRRDVGGSEICVKDCGTVSGQENCRMFAGRLDRST